MDNQIIEIPVDKIVNDKNATIGLSTSNSTLNKNFKLFFTEETMKEIISEKELGKPVRFYGYFCQFIIQLIYQLGVGFRIQLMDYHKDNDVALDQYLDKVDWPIEDRNKVMEIHLKILERYENNVGVLVVK